MMNATLPNEAEPRFWKLSPWLPLVLAVPVCLLVAGNLFLFPASAWMTRVASWLTVASLAIGLMDLLRSRDAAKIPQEFRRRNRRPRHYVLLGFALLTTVIAVINLTDFSNSATRPEWCNKLKAATDPMLCLMCAAGVLSLSLDCRAWESASIGAPRA